jgi:hypothetical protein
VTLRALCVFALAWLLGKSAAPAAVLDGIGAIGAGSSAAGPTQYPALLQDYRGLNFGGVGVPYAYGHVGADSDSILLPGDQVDQLVTQVTAGNITLATFFIGNNDYIDAASPIANGSLAGATLAAYQAEVQANIETAVNEVQTAGAAVVLGGLSNIVHAPSAASIKANPVARARVEGALETAQAMMSGFALSQGLPFIDFYELLSAVYDTGSVQIGGVDLILTGYDISDPHYFWEDPFQPGILVRGAIANLFLQAMNEGYGTSIPLLTDLEILTIAGLEDEYVEETFAATYAYPSFVSVPEPSALALAGVGLALVGCGWLVRRRPRGRLARGESLDSIMKKFDAATSSVLQ